MGSFAFEGRDTLDGIEVGEDVGLGVGRGVGLSVGRGESLSVGHGEGIGVGRGVGSGTVRCVGRGVGLRSPGCVVGPLVGTHFVGNGVGSGSESRNVASCLGCDADLEGMVVSTWEAGK